MKTGGDPDAYKKAIESEFKPPIVCPALLAEHRKVNSEFVQNLDLPKGTDDVA